MNDNARKDEDSWISAIGISDLATGKQTASNALSKLSNTAEETLRAMESFDGAGMLFFGLVARSHGLHQGAIDVTEMNNPYAAFTIIRAYAETSAAVLYAIDHPAEIETLLGAGERPTVAPGRLLNNMQKRAPTYKIMYEQLSRYAHPTSASFMAGFAGNDDGTYHWSSTPRFRDERERMVAYAWISEIADNTAALFAEYAEKYRLHTRQND